MKLELRLLGGLRLLNKGRAVPLPASKKTRALLGFLALSPGPHSRSDLCDLLWDGPADPRAALRWSLTKLRPLVDQDQPRILADRRTVALETAGLEIDTETVTGLWSAGPETTEQLLALRARFEGELLADLDQDDLFAWSSFLATERERLRNLRISVLGRLLKVQGLDPPLQVEVAREWVGLEPLDELAHARLIRAHLASGQLESARRIQAACTSLFQRELGRQPGPAVLEALKTQVAPPPSAEARSPKRSSPLSFAQARDIGLFGRVLEATLLERHLTPAVPGVSNPLLWFEAEPGMGKTRLLGEFTQRAKSRGMRTLFGRAFEAESARSLALWEDVLGEVRLGDGQLERGELFERLAAVLAEQIPKAGLAIALDDLQWADEISTSFLAWLVRRRLPGLVLVAAARPGELEDNPAAHGLLQTLEAEQLVDRHALQPLDKDEIRALIENVNPRAEIPDSWAHTGGNPLFAILLATGSEEESNSELESYIGTRLARLGEREQELLSIGAAIGRHFSVELVQEVSGMPLGMLIGVLERLQRSGVLKAGRDDQVDFAHDLLRKAVYDGLSAPSRRLLHRQIARVMDSQAGSSTQPAAELARQAARAGNDELAARASFAAGRECVRVSAQDDARRHAKRGLQHVKRLHGPAQRKLTIEGLWIEVHAGLGRHESGELRRHLAQVVDAASERSEHNTAREGLYLLSIIDEEAGDFEAAQKWTLAAVDAGLKGDASTRSLALANTGRCLAQLGRRLDEAERFLDQAVAENEHAPVELPWGRGLLARHMGQLPEAKEHLEAALEAAMKLGKTWPAFECEAMLARVEIQLEDFAGAIARGPNLLASAASLGGGSEAALTHVVVELARYAQADTALGDFEQALEALRATDSKALLVSILNQAAQLDHKRGHTERAHERASEALTAARAVGRELEVAKAEALLQDTFHCP